MTGVGRDEPVFAILFAWGFFGVRPRLLEGLGVALGLGGMALLNFDLFLGNLPAGIQLFSLFKANPALLELVRQVGQRGESLSAGERQLVALVRAYVADPDLLLLDEATSAVDPATELRLQRALDRLTRGRTTVSIAHRLSTAQAADVVLVFDAGCLVENGPHDELVAADGIYARLHASWIRQSARQ